MTGASALQAVVALLALAGCSVRVAADREGHEADRVAAVLGSEGVASDKVAEPGTAGHYAIDVSRDDAARAVAVLNGSGHPRKPTAGVLEALGKGSLVPSRTAEHARWLQGVAGELERTLEEIDGVVSARVHLSAERKDPLSAESPAAPSAAVLVKRRAGSPALAEGDIQKLVQGALPSLSAERTSVVQTEGTRVSPAAELVRVGPFTTPRHMASGLRAALAATALLNVALVACLAALWWKTRKRAPAGPP
jgi:type III secretion protein J